MLRGLVARLDARLVRRLVRAGAVLVLAALVAAAWAVFRAAGEDYWAFWLDAGPFIGLATAALGWAWGEIDRHPGLVSADPLDYAGSALQVSGMPLIVLGRHLGSEARTKPLPSGDIALAALLGAVLMVAIFAWLLLIAPAQYFAFLIAGAPSRLALASNARIYARMEGTRVRFADAAALDTAAFRKEDGWWDASMRDRPVSAAGAFLAAAVLVIDAVA